MTIETEISSLTQATTDLLDAVNVRKATLDEKVGNADAFAQASLTSANNAEASAATANTKAGEGAGYAAQALAIYGNTEAMQTAVAQAAAQASVAAGHAASASSVVQQDLSGVNAAALHRSPNAVTAMFVYDTGKDSDGGAWTEKCQHTSWYNEGINGKWLGAQPSEVYARNTGAVLGPELVTNGAFAGIANGTDVTTLPGWAAYGTPAFRDVQEERLRIQATAGSQGARLTLSTTIGKRYIVKATVAGDLGLASVYSDYTGDVSTLSGSVDIQFTATATSSVIFFRAANNSAGTTYYDNISVREVTAQTTQTGDYFQLTTDGKFYKLNDTSGTTETFRGNKAKFPKLAGIVVETKQIVLYDLTEPGCPMWRVWGYPARTYTNPSPIETFSMFPPVSVAALSGKLVFAVPCTSGDGTSYVSGAVTFDIANDKYTSIKSNYGGTLGVIGQKNIVADWNTAAIWKLVTGVGGIASQNANAVAMTVLPDAPVDPATGLQVPTIAVGTSGGLSVIKHDGVVVSQLQGTAHVAFSKDAKLWAAGSDGGSFAVRLINKAFTGVEASFTNIQYQIGAPYISGRGVERIPQLRAVSGSSVYAVDPDTYTSVNVLRSNNSKRGATLAAYVSNTYNTGHMTGDIRRAYLADVDVGSVSGTELVTNGTFDTDLSSWQLSGAYRGGAIEWAAPGKLRLNGDGSASLGAVSNAIPLVVGRTYLVSFTKVAATGYSAIYAGYSPSTTIFGSTGFGYGTAAGTFSAIFTATSNVFYVTPVMWSAVAYAEFDNISVIELVADRSYKAQGASIAGSLTKSAVASAAQLVACSGFSNTNYLRESYSADLDFGAGEWSASAWANIPASIPTTSFPEIGGEIVVNGGFDASSDWTLNTGVTISGGALNFNNPAIYTGASQSIAASAATMRCYKLQVVVSSVTSGAVSAFIGNSGANDNIQSGLIYSPGTYTVYGILAANQVLFVTFRAETSNLVAVIDSISIKEVSPAILASRQFSSGSYIRMGVAPKGQLIAEAFDGVTRRIAATTAAYNTATWAKAEACYTTDGTLAIRVNGVEAAATRGNPLLTLNNANAVLTIGNSYAADAPFPGSLALVKFSATVPTAEQSVWMYEQEKQMFRENAQVCLPDSGAIVDLTYDDATDKWIAVSATNESEWSGLVRTGVKAVPAGSFSKVAATSGVKLEARTTTNPGVDITIPAYGLREELVKRSESAARLARNLTTFDYVGGFTANTTTGSTSITSVAGLSYPVSHIGAQVTGTGIPTGTVITAVSGTTIYLSKAATATGTAVQISFTDFTLPVGYEAKSVMSAGALKQEGATKDYTRLFDGFKETVRFGVAPGYTAWVQIQATRSAA